MRRIIAAAAAALFLAGAPVSAGIIPHYDGDESRIHHDRSWDRVMWVQARYRAPSDCYRIVDHLPETRADEPGPPVTVIHTIVVAKDRGQCGSGSAVLKEDFMVHADTYTLWVRLNFVTPDGKVLKTERLGIIGV